MVRLKKVETPEDEPETLPIRMTPRATIGIEFRYHSDFDQNGILYYIGTNGNTESFENPSQTGRVKVWCRSFSCPVFFFFFFKGEAEFTFSL